MLKSEVVGLIGDPTERVQHEDFTEWFYKKDVKVLTFVEDRLVLVQDDNREYNRLKALRQLRAKLKKDRPKVEMPVTFNQQATEDDIPIDDKANIEAAPYEN